MFVQLLVIAKNLDEQPAWVMRDLIRRVHSSVCAALDTSKGITAANKSYLGMLQYLELRNEANLDLNPFEERAGQASVRFARRGLRQVLTKIVCFTPASRRVTKDIRHVQGLRSSIRIPRLDDAFLPRTRKRRVPVSVLLC
jgi:hypothetical protein